MATNLFTGVTNNLWATATNWSQGTVPTSTDGHVTTFDATSPNCTTEAVARACNALDFTGYTNTFTMGRAVYIYGNFTLSSTMTVNATGWPFNLQADCNITSNGLILTNPLYFGAPSKTVTLLDDFIVGSVTVENTTTSTIINGYSITTNGGFVASITSGTVSGTTNIIMDGTGTLSTNNATTGSIKNNLIFNSAGTITIGTKLNYNTGTLTHIVGTITTTNSTLSCSLATTFNTNGMTWNNIIWTGSVTYTLTSDFTATGDASISTATNNTLIDGANLYIGGNLTTPATTGSVGGTSTIILNGTGLWESTGGTGYFNCNVEINTAGTITLGSVINGANGGKTWTYTAGTVDATTNSNTMNLGQQFLDLNDLTLYNVKVLLSGTAVVGLRSGFRVAGLLNNDNRATHESFKRTNSEYPPEQSDTYVKATSQYSTSYTPFYATNPTKSEVGTRVTTSWISGNTQNTNQRFHIDLGSAKTIKEVYYVNGHDTGTANTGGARNFTLWGSNTAGDFADLTYANDGTWTQLTTDVSEFAQHVASDIVDPQYVAVTNSTAYRYYAFKFADNWGYVGYMNVRRIELREENTPKQVKLTLLAGGTQDIRMVDFTGIDAGDGQTLYTFRGALDNATNVKVLSTPQTVGTVF